jgi:protein required for attachment to host cells
MIPLCVVVADDARARLFSLEEAPREEALLASSQLVERACLNNAQGKTRGIRRFPSIGKRKRLASTSSALGYPDHRLKRDQQMRRLFARQVVSLVAEFVRRNAVGKLVLMAEPRMLGALREQADEILPGTLTREEFPEERSWHSIAAIQTALLRHGVIQQGRGAHDHRA